MTAVFTLQLLHLLKNCHKKVIKLCQSHGCLNIWPSWHTAEILGSLAVISQGFLNPRKKMALSSASPHPLLNCLLKFDKLLPNRAEQTKPATGIAGKKGECSHFVLCSVHVFLACKGNSGEVCNFLLLERVNCRMASKLKIWLHPHDLSLPPFKMCVLSFSGSTQSRLKTPFPLRHSDGHLVRAEDSYL